MIIAGVRARGKVRVRGCVRVMCRVYEYECG